MKRLALLTTSLIAASTAFAQSAAVQSAAMQSPAYAECTSLANSNPGLALTKADAWLKMDTGVAPQHCRAMALYGLQRFAEAGDALSSVREMISPENLTLRGYVAKQAARAYNSAGMPDKALAVFSAQIGEISASRADNASAAKQSAELLLERARLNITYGKLEDAASDLDHAVTLTPINEDVLLERAGVFEKLGDRALAASDVQAVMVINKENKKAQEMLSRLDHASPLNAMAPLPGTNAADYSTKAPAAAAPKPKPAAKKPTTPATQAP